MLDLHQWVIWIKVYSDKIRKTLKNVEKMHKYEKDGKLLSSTYIFQDEFFFNGISGRKLWLMCTYPLFLQPDFFPCKAEFILDLNKNKLSKNKLSKVIK